MDVTCLNKNWKIWIIILLILSSVQQVNAQVEPVKIEKTDTCPFCGMPIRDMRFAFEVVYKDGSVIKSDEIGELFEHIPDVGRDSNIAAIFVHDYYTEEWIDGREAYYVVGGNVFTPMGYGIVAFEAEEDARRFMQERDGGKILSFKEVTERDLDPGEMMMPGISNELFLVSVVATLFLTFGIVEYMERRERKRGKGKKAYFKYDILQIGILRRIVKARPFQFLVQLPFIAIFLLIILAGLFGTQVGGRNIATVITWVIWWIFLIFLIIFFGKLWCTVCPWNAIAGWIQRFSFWKKNDNLFTLNKEWPKRFKNIYLATGFFVLLTWLELGYNVTYSPRYTAYLAILLLTMAVVSAVIFERRVFCRYACLVGRVSGLYAMFAATELRRKDKNVCDKICRPTPNEGEFKQNPKIRDCAKGNERGYSCPTFEYPRIMDLNTYCILCSECVKSCKYNNIGFNIRPFAMDLIKSKKTRKDEAYLSLVMLSMTIFHGLTMVPSWFFFEDRLEEITGLGYYGSFTLGMTIVLLLPIVFYYILCLFSKALSGNKEIPVKQIFINYAYPVLPIALLYHLAHNSMHFFTEAQKVIPVLSDPFGYGWNLFGTAGWTLKPLLPIFTIWKIQVFLIIFGHVYGIYIASKIARRTFDDEGQAVRSLIPQLIVLIGFSLVSLTLLAQPMLMRTAM